MYVLIILVLIHFKLTTGLVKQGVVSLRLCFKCLLCLLGQEPEFELHSHGFVYSGRLSAGQRGGTEFNAQTQGKLVHLLFSRYFHKYMIVLYFCQ